MSNRPVRLPTPARVGIVGATGAVGMELLTCLEQRDFPLQQLRLFASERSADRRLHFRGDTLPVEVLREDSLAALDLVLCSAGSQVAARFAPWAAERGAIAIDNSSAFRTQPEVPLVVPEVNAETLAAHTGIIANPNCVAIIASLALRPLQRAAGLRRLSMATYQAASGGGAAAMQELLAATRAALAGESFPPRVLPHPYAFNLFSHNSALDADSGLNEEETKVTRELRRLLSSPVLPIGVTCIRVPVLRAHAMALTVELERALSVSEARRLMAEAAGLRLVDDRERNLFPMPLAATGIDEVLVGRIRTDGSDPSGHTIALFVAGDQLRKGAALNAVQIAEQLAVRRL
ncbi:MAG TPA: aspartate-semialdehyde dehydrogenase [Steroidobacteraceae bacterium]|nr:aspartate-semialdehyde dehydrogenase [Steroidobacteraceae bacterium]